MSTSRNPLLSTELVDAKQFKGKGQIMAQIIKQLIYLLIFNIKAYNLLQKK